MHVLIAPNAFKHSLKATDAALAIQEGLLQSRLSCTCERFPIGDGGDGTGNLMIDKLAGTSISLDVHDPIDRPIMASFGLVQDGKTAVIEMASASGLHLLKPYELSPCRATSFGTGQLMKHALDEGVSNIVLAVGGSATVDGGTGILRALGVRFLDASGHELTEPGSLVKLTHIDTSRLHPRLASCTISILCDVDNVLLGPQGAAAVFGPQKGASPADVQHLDACLATLAKVTQRATGVDCTTVKHGGAAGGVSAGLYAILQAQLVNGIEFFLDFTGFDDALKRADLVITGEGSIDEQTLQGKGPYGVAARAKQFNVPVVGLAGKLPLAINEPLHQYFDMLLAIGNAPTALTMALRDTKQNLTRTSYQLGNLLAIPK